MEYSDWAKQSFNELDQIKVADSKLADSGRKIVLGKTMNVEVDGFSFECYNKVLPRHTRAITSINADSDGFNYDETQKIFAGVLADISVNPDFDTKFWIGYDEETGNLIQLVMYIYEQAMTSKPEIKSFR